MASALAEEALGAFLDRCHVALVEEALAEHLDSLLAGETYAGMHGTMAENCSSLGEPCYIRCQYRTAVEVVRRRCTEGVEIHDVAIHGEVIHDVIEVAEQEDLGFQGRTTASSD